MDKASANSYLTLPLASDRFASTTAAANPTYQGGYSGPDPAQMAYQGAQQAGAQQLSAWNNQATNNPWQTVLGNVAGQGMGLFANGLSRFGQTPPIVPGN